MTVRKKKLLAMVVSAIVIAAVFYVAAVNIQQADKEKNQKRNKMFEGTWESGDGVFSMQVRRVTGGHIVFSLKNQENHLEGATAYAVGGDQYEFPYRVSHVMLNDYAILYGGDSRGYINLKDDAIEVNIPMVEGKKDAIEYKGVLRKKGEIRRGRVVHLGESLGTEDRVPSSLRKRCVFEKGKDGRVARIYVSLIGKKEDDSLYDCDVRGVNRLCFEGDCEANFGRPESSEEFNDGRKKNIYRSDGYMYVILFSENGLVSSVDCRKEDAFDGEFEGDFLCRGDAVVKYMGSYSLGEKVKLPEGIRRLCKGAFSVEEGILYGKILSNKLSLPASVQVEAGAFERCGKWALTLEEGWTTVPKGAFSRILPSLKKRDNWVTVNLPQSLKRLEERAFCLTGEDVDQNTMERFLSGEHITPLTVNTQQGLEYIGDHALSGASTGRLPDSVRYIGSGNVRADRILPSGLEELADGAVYKVDMGYGMDCYDIKLPLSLKKIGEDAFVGKAGYCFDIDGVSASFSCDKIGNLWSKDKTVLYYSAPYIKKDMSYYGGDIIKNPLAGRKRKEGGWEFIIPEGTRKMCRHSLDIANQRKSKRSRIIIPASVRELDRQALFACGDGGEVVWQGDVPEFTGNLEKQNIAWITIRLKPGIRDEFVEKLLEGQNGLTGEAEKWIIKSVEEDQDVIA